jgi:hypothetical protein
MDLPSQQVNLLTLKIRLQNRYFKGEECFFWATHAGAELDLLVVRGRKRFGFEFKRTIAPGVTPSMRSALVDLKLMKIDVIHAGENTYMMDKKIRAVALSRLLDDIEPL